MSFLARAQDRENCGYFKWFSRETKGKRGVQAPRLLLLLPIQGDNLCHRSLTRNFPAL